MKITAVNQETKTDKRLDSSTQERSQKSYDKRHKQQTKENKRRRRRLIIDRMVKMGRSKAPITLMTHILSHQNRLKSQTLTMKTSDGFINILTAIAALLS